MTRTTLASPMARLPLRSTCLATSRSMVMLARTLRRSRRAVVERATGATLVMRFLTTSSISPTLVADPTRPATPTTSRTSRPSSSSTSPSLSLRSPFTVPRTPSSLRPTLPPLPVVFLSTRILPRAPKYLISTMSLGHDEGFHTSHSGVAHRTLT
ncbi:hypothetical protein N8I77_002387 [Diaporthe amygdali]|uniref:Uncharacterized protein n=1 Tax=Phomopsis amygdali TaxID=1214568 RepID=A0AAD9WBR8_PHOAM|nr:hypothetical protein N8I77_002387 [Diaporthe amygdali]